MAVTITPNTLSARVKYLNVSPSTANEDAKDIVLAMADTLVTLGWTRYDTAGATAVVGTDSDAGVILRRACQDFANSGHYNYLGLRLVGSATTTYTFYLIQAADWTGTTSMSSFVNAAQSSVYTPNTTGSTRFFDFLQGGTIWLFDSGKTLVIQTSSGLILTKSLETTWIISEYKKEFGEHVDSSTGYIHNGVFTKDRWLLDGYGVDTAAGENNISKNIVGDAGVAPFSNQSMYVGHTRANDYAMAATNVTYLGGRSFAMGADFSQFNLTEAPAISGTTQANTLTVNSGPPVSCGLGFTTRMLMGYIGYIGHLSTTFKTSITAQFLGARFSQAANNNINTFFDAVNVFNNNDNRYMHDTANGLFGADGAYTTFVNSIKEFSPLSSTLQYTIYEPTLSCGTINGLPRTGPQYKYSMLGKMYDLKIFGPFTAEKYNFLDSITIPCNSEGFYEEGGVDKDFWLLPTGNHMAFLMPKT